MGRVLLRTDVSNKVPGNPYAILDCVDGSGSIANGCEQQGSGEPIRNLGLR